MRAAQLRLRAGRPQAPHPAALGEPRGTTRSRYIRLEEWAQVQALIASYEELWTIVNELTAVNLALLHSTPSQPRRRPPTRR